MGVLDILTHNDLDSALKNKQLQVAFQPSISLATLSALGAEAFLRWQHPALGLLPANLFMPFAREQGRTREVAQFMLRETLRSVADWRRAGLDWKAYVNVDGSDLADGMLADSIALLLCEFELPPEVLTLDIRESDLVERGAQVLPHLTGLRTMGVGIALDTVPGEAPLQDISALPLTEMKIAGPAIIRFMEQTREAGLGRILGRLNQAHAAGLKTCAVRVESEATLWALQRVGFDAAQGSYISPPISLNELVRWDHVWRQAAEQLTAQKAETRAAAGETAEDAGAAAEAHLDDRFEDAHAPFTVDMDETAHFDEAAVSSAIDAISPPLVDTNEESDTNTPEIAAEFTPDVAHERAPQEARASEEEEFDETVADDAEFSFDAPAAGDDVSDAPPDAAADVELHPFPEFAESPPEAEAPHSAEGETAHDDAADDAFTFDAPHAAPVEAEPYERAPPAPVVARQRVARTPQPLPPGEAPGNITFHRSSAAAAGTPPAASKAGFNPLQKGQSAAKDAAPLEHTLIERRIPGVAKPVTMQVAAATREGFFGRLKSSRKK